MKGIIQLVRGPRRAVWLVLPVVLLLMMAGVGAVKVAPVSAQPAPGFGRVTVTKVVQNAAGVTQPTAAGAGYSFVLTLAGSGVQTTLTTDATATATVDVAPGTYTITENARPGSTLVSITPGQSFQLASGQTVNLTATNRVAGSGSITITKQIVDATGAVVTTADRSGFQFAVAGPSGFAATVTSDANGQASLTNLGAGSYSVTEQPRTGFTFVAATVNGVPASNGQQFTLSDGGAATVVVQNRQGAGTGTVTITKQIVDAQGAVVASADRSGFTFTITCGAAQGQQTTDAAGMATLTNVPAGSCTISEAARTGFTLSSVTVAGSPTNIGNNGAFTVTAGQTTSITVQNRSSAAAAGETVQLFPGCNNVAATWPNGTPTATVAAAVSPSTILIAIWRFDASANRFFGYSPIPNAPNDLLTVNRLDAIFICVDTAGTLTRPTL